LVDHFVISLEAQNNDRPFFIQSETDVGLHYGTCTSWF